MSSTIDQQFVEYIVKSLVSKPDAVKIDRRIDEKGVLLELTVDPEDLGRVIGKRGGTAQSLRILLRALGTKNDARYNLKIIDNGPPRPDRYERHDEPRDEIRSGEYTPQPRPSSAPNARQDEPADEPAPDDSAAIVDESAQSDTVDESVAVEEAKGEVTADEPAEEVASVEPENSDEEHENVVSKTRKELEDLDDLDI